MSVCDTNNLLVGEDIIIENSSEKFTTIVKQIFNRSLQISNITDYIFNILPTTIPILLTVFIPIMVFLFTNRFKFELSHTKNTILFIGINIVLSTLICISYLYSYDLVLSMKSSICSVKEYAISMYNILSVVVDTINSPNCQNISLDIDLRYIINQFMDVLNTIDPYLSYYYAMVLVSPQILLLPTILFYSIIFGKLNIKILFYALFTLLVMISWLIASFAFSLSFTASNLHMEINTFYEEPEQYFGENCVINTNNMTLTPCNMINICNSNNSQSLLVGLFNGTETDSIQSVIERYQLDLVCSTSSISLLSNPDISCSTINHAKKIIKASKVSNSLLLLSIVMSITCFASFSILPFFTVPGQGIEIKFPKF
tara:strand:- start:2729 stop:3841 length:1113 start_codon:yes stop_codon:yes gene_type:complete